MVTLIVIYSLCSSSLLIINKVQWGPLSYAPHVTVLGDHKCRMNFHSTCLQPSNALLYDRCA
jgi:hypothetical protein